MLDVIIIGAGTGGLAALREVRKQTERVVVINDGPWGTMCARVGCMPSKALIEAANSFHRRLRFSELGIAGADGVTADIPAVLRRIRSLRDDFVAGNLDATKDLGARAIHGRARLVGPDCVEVDGKQLRARKIIIATGSRPIVPAAWRDLGELILTTDTLFEQNDLPPRVAVIGQGAIGVEIGQALSRLGVNVFAFDASHVVAGVSDPEVASTLIELLRREYHLHLGANVELSRTVSGVRVHADHDDFEVDRVVVAIGRKPNIDSIGLESLGVPLDEQGMPELNAETMQLGALPIYMAGDASSSPALLHEAADDGYAAGSNALGDTPRAFPRRTPLAIGFCDPNVAQIGASFAQLDAANISIGQARFEDQGRARIMLRNDGLLRIYVDKRSQIILGAELCAPSGEHLAHLLALAIDRKLSVTELLRMPFYHPVLEEGLRTALRSIDVPA